MSYHIDDEPRPGALSHLVVNPLWPLLAIMFGGALLSWPWYAFNSMAVGSPTRRREIAWVVGGVVGAVALIAILLALAEVGLVVGVGIRYALILLTVWKLCVSYWLYTLQSRSFHLYQHFGGRVRNGMVVVALGYFAMPKIYAALPSIVVAVLR